MEKIFEELCEKKIKKIEELSENLQNFSKNIIDHKLALESVLKN
jgi:hypothetical protein